MLIVKFEYYAKVFIRNLTNYINANQKL